MTFAVGVDLPEAELVDFCHRHQVRELALFGSAARGEMRPDSDIDLLVDFLPEARPLLELRNDVFPQFVPVCAGGNSAGSGPSQAGSTGEFHADPEAYRHAHHG